jgi:phosphoglycolate phosphatase
MTLRLAIFDCDGTLVDSQATICTAMAEAFAEAGIAAPDPAAVRRIVGLSLPEAIAVLAPDVDAFAMAQTYKNCFHRMRLEGRVEEQLYAGVSEMLAVMEEAGWLLGVATGKSDRGLRLVLEHHGLAHRFVTLQTADRHPSKPHPAMIDQALSDAGVERAHAVMIGDTSFDIAMAHNAGVRAIGVAWGYHDAAELLAEGADAVARHPSEIPALALGEVA